MQNVLPCACEEYCFRYESIFEINYYCYWSEISLCFSPCGFHKKNPNNEFLLFAEGGVGHMLTFFGIGKKGPPVRPPKNAPVACGTN